jgi:hypothetical protein
VKTSHFYNDTVELNQQDKLKVMWLEKLKKLRDVMDEWSVKNTQMSMSSTKCKQWSSDWDRFIKLKELFEFHRPAFIKKRHMIELNQMYKRYK